LRHEFNALQTGKPQSLCDFRGKVLVIVNTASYCGYTKQYEGLEALYRKYKDRGSSSSAFHRMISVRRNRERTRRSRSSAGRRTASSFPMFEKTSVLGSRLNLCTPPSSKQRARRPQWNFHKYVVDRSGTRITSFASAVEPTQKDFVASIERLLGDKP
jgi:glutathione peroxidase